MDAHMKILSLILFVVIMSGCATQPKVWDYPTFNLRIVKASPVYIRKVCKPKFNDMGMIIRTDTKILGCWKSDRREIWIDWEYPEMLLHELCHADGSITRRRCGEEYQWDEK